MRHSIQEAKNAPDYNISGTEKTSVKDIYLEQRGKKMSPDQKKKKKKSSARHFKMSKLEQEIE